MCLQKFLGVCVSGWQGQRVKAVSSGQARVVAVGVVFVVVGLFFNFLWKDALEYAVEKELVLSPSSRSYSFWVQNPLPLHIDFYFFNWTNPTDLRQSSPKPLFRQLGPYRFREDVRKVRVTWNDNNTVSYGKLRRWYFEPAASNGSLDDVVTTLNIIALTAARSTRYWNRLTRIPLSLMLSSGTSLSIRKRVREFLFEGFRDPLIETALRIPGLSSQVPFDRFGWFYKRNDSADFDGHFNVETGANGLPVLGALNTWNFNNRTPFYEGSCGDVTGSAGDFWPPPPATPARILLFSPDVCRYVSFAFAGEATVGQIKGFRYDSGRELLDNGTADPKNQCFCGGRCLPSGALNVSGCRSGAPVFISYPHFHLADPFYLSRLEGLRPEPAKHETYVILEQRWGVPLEVAIRLQVNALIESDSGVRMFDGVPTMLFPMIWFQQKVTAPESITAEIDLLLWLPSLGPIASALCYLLGLFCLLKALFCQNTSRKLLIMQPTNCCCSFAFRPLFPTPRRRGPAPTAAASDVSQQTDANDRPISK